MTIHQTHNLVPQNVKILFLPVTILYVDLKVCAIVTEDFK